MSKGIVLDIETDALDASKIHCIVSRDVNTNEVKEFVQDECYTIFPQWSKEVDKFYMHNGLSFDARVINKLTDANIPMSNAPNVDFLASNDNPNYLARPSA